MGQVTTARHVYRLGSVREHLEDRAVSPSKDWTPAKFNTHVGGVVNDRADEFNRLRLGVQEQFFGWTDEQAKPGVKKRSFCAENGEAMEALLYAYVICPLSYQKLFSHTYLIPFPIPGTMYFNCTSRRCRPRAATMILPNALRNTPPAPSASYWIPTFKPLRRLGAKAL